MTSVDWNSCILRMSCTRLTKYLKKDLTIKLKHSKSKDDNNNNKRSVNKLSIWKKKMENRKQWISKKIAGSIKETVLIIVCKCLIRLLVWKLHHNKWSTFNMATNGHIHTHTYTTKMDHYWPHNESASWANCTQTLSTMTIRVVVIKRIRSIETIAYFKWKWSTKY